CCQQQRPLGWVPEDTLVDIWRGQRRAALMAALAGDDFSLGCQTCADEIALEGRSASYAGLFDLEPAGLPDALPTFIEFNLSNRCNLRCIQCNPELSSSIRALTDLPPVVGIYGDEFFDQLRQFLPALQRAQFAGGEPFLAAENYRVWEMIAELAPGLAVTVITNATHLTQRAKEILERVPMSIVASIDGATASTFESIRLGAAFPEVVANVEWLAEYCRRVGTSCSINHCLMPQNVHEFADLLEWAEGLGLAVQVSVVRSPERCSLSSLPTDELVRISESLQAQDARVSGALSVNLPVWRRETDRIRRWVIAGQQARLDARERAQLDRVALFPRPGPAVDSAAIKSAVEASSTGPEVWTVRVTPDQHVIEAPAEFAALLSVDDLGGLTLLELGGLVEATYGELLDRTFLEQSDSLIDSVETYRHGVVRSALVPKRNDDGWTTEVTMFVSCSEVAES
ncbi:MAG: radical SAM protein, partial [Actinomycetes bacterium]